MSWKLSRTVLRGAVGGNADRLLDKRLDEKTKRPYAFALRSGEPFAFGGVWDAWKDPATEDWLQSFSIITTDPNELTAMVHDRMPVIVKPSDYGRWLDRTEAERPPAGLLRPYEAAEMTVHEVDPRVGNVRNDEPSLCNIWQCPPNPMQLLCGGGDGQALVGLEGRGARTWPRRGSVRSIRGKSKDELAATRVVDRLGAK